MIVNLNNQHPAVQYLKGKCPIISKVIDLVGDIDYEVWSDGYEFVVHEIVEQMLSTKAGNAIFRRLKEICGGIVSVDRICKLSDEQIRSTGMANSKVRYIRNFTEAIVNKDINLKDLEPLEDSEIMKILMTVKGIGQWTSKMYLIFVLDRPNVLPIEDAAFLQSYKWAFNTTDISKQAIENNCRNWHPYKSIASRFMYRALDMGFVKQPFIL